MGEQLKGSKGGEQFWNHCRERETQACWDKGTQTNYRGPHPGFEGGMFFPVFVVITTYRFFHKQMNWD